MFALFARRVSAELARVHSDLALMRDQLAEVREELERLRPVARAASNFLNFPDPPPQDEGPEIAGWDDAMERHYRALLNAVARAGAGR